MVVGWQEQMDNYCERTDLTFWSEPLNAITNAAFLIAALVVFLILRRVERMDRGLGLSLLVLTAIGIGSFLFHTFATRWASTADVTPILLYIMVYLYHIGTRLFDLRWWWGLAMALGFIPYSFVVVSALQPVVGSLNGSIAYMPVPIGLLIFAGLLWGKRPEVAKGFLIGIAILCLSLFARTNAQLGTRNGPLEPSRRSPGPHPLELPPSRGYTTARPKRRIVSMAIDIETARRAAHLARIEIEEERLPALAQELSAVLTFMEQLGEVDIDGVEPMTSVTPMALKQRQDVVTDGDIQDRSLANAPEAREGFFAVPKVVE